MLKTLADLRAAGVPEWIWRGYLLPSGLTLLSAQSKSGKTTFISHLLRAMWTDEGDYMGQPLRPVPTLWISEEADSRIAQRADDMGYSDMWPIAWLTTENRTWEQTMAYIRKYAMLYHNPLVIVDTLSRHWGIEDENDNAKIEKAINPLIALTRTTGMSTLLVHHTRKSGGTGGNASRGGSALFAAVDITIEMYKLEDGPSTTRKFNCYTRYGETPDEPFLAKMTGAGYQLISVEDELADPRSSVFKVWQWLLTNAGKHQLADIAAGTAMPERTATAALSLLLKDGRVQASGRGVRGNPRLFYADTEMEELA